MKPKSVRQAGKTADGYLPQPRSACKHSAEKEDYPNAILEMHAYLQEAPLGPYAAQIKRNLERLQNAGFVTVSDPPGH
jgi:hypothetical protein